MPYINQDSRNIVDKKIDNLIEEFHRFQPEEIEGVLNYTISRLLSSGIKAGHDQDEWRYMLINRAVGVLECVKQEFYRRVASPYETQSMNKNLDVREYVGYKTTKNQSPHAITFSQLQCDERCLFQTDDNWVFSYYNGKIGIKTGPNTATIDGIDSIYIPGYLTIIPIPAE